VLNGHLSRGRVKRRNSGVRHSSIFVLLALSLVAVCDGCSRGEEAGGSATGASAVEPTSSATTSGIENAPSGGPPPVKLQGHWLLISKSGHKFKNRFELEIRDRQYGFPVGLVRGHVVAHDAEVDF
jgi:hypothetical protein